MAGTTISPIVPARSTCRMPEQPMPDQPTEGTTEAGTTDRRNQDVLSRYPEGKDFDALFFTGGQSFAY